MQKFTVHTATEKKEVLAASNWRELTLEQIIQIETDWRQDPTVLKAFSILTGLSLEITENLNDPDIEKKVWSIMSFMKTPPNWKELKPPKALTIEGKMYKIPTKIGGLMLGQKIMLLQAADDIETILEKIPLSIAIIMQPYIDRVKNKGVLKYDSERVEYLAGQIVKSNGLDCYASAVFFFAKLRSSLSFRTSDSKTYQPAKDQMKTLSNKWLKPNG